MSQYYMFAVGFALAVALSLATNYKYRMPKRRVWFYSITFSYGFIAAWIMGRIYTPIAAAHGEKLGSNLAMFGAVMFTPLMEIATVYLEKGIKTGINRLRTRRPKVKGKKRRAPFDMSEVSVKNTLDMLAPDIFLVMLCGKIQCHINGCCHGFLCDWGIRSPIAPDVRVFPVQLCEAATTGLVLLTCYFVKHSRFYRRGMAYPLTAGLFSLGRFGWEFARYYPDAMRRLFLGMTLWQCCCLVVIAASAVSVIVLYKTRPSDPLPKRAKRK